MRGSAADLYGALHDYCRPANLIEARDGRKRVAASVFQLFAFKVTC